MSLTGGLDTRMIMAWHKSPPDSLPCYSFGSMFRDCQDVVLARRVARACGQTHEVIPVAGEFLSGFSRYAERSVYVTDGCVDVSHSPDLYVNERAAEIAPVRMTGNHGGEVLRHVLAFKPVEPAPGLFAPELRCHLDTAVATYDRLVQGNPLSFTVFRQAPWRHYGLLSLEQTQVAIRSPFLDNDVVRTVFRAPQSACTNNNISRRLIVDGDAALAHIPTDRGPISNPNGSQEKALRSMIDFTIKAEYAYDRGMPHWVARIDHMFSRFHLERLFLGRHKFYHFRIWYRDALARYVREMLLDPRTLSRPYLQRGALENIVQGHLKGNRNYTSEIHKVLTLELVSRLFVD
jgi:asparagine synthase (glutamine-hydrolysing)